MAPSNTPGSPSSNAWPARSCRALPRHILDRKLFRALHCVPSRVGVRPTIPVMVRLHWMALLSGPKLAPSFSSVPISTKADPFERLVSRSTMTCALHRPEWREQRLQVGLVDVIGQIAHVKFLAHDRTPRRRLDDPSNSSWVEEKGAHWKAQTLGKSREQSRCWSEGTNAACSIAMPTDASQIQGESKRLRGKPATTGSRGRPRTASAPPQPMIVFTTSASFSPVSVSP